VACNREIESAWLGLPAPGLVFTQPIAMAIGLAPDQRQPPAFLRHATPAFPVTGHGWPNATREIESAWLGLPAPDLVFTQPIAMAIGLAPDRRQPPTFLRHSTPDFPVTGHGWPNVTGEIESAWLGLPASEEA